MVELYRYEERKFANYQQFPQLIIIIVERIMKNKKFRFPVHGVLYFDIAELRLHGIEKSERPHEKSGMKTLPPLLASLIWHSFLASGPFASKCEVKTNVYHYTSEIYHRHPTTCAMSCDVIGQIIFEIKEQG